MVRARDIRPLWAAAGLVMALGACAANSTDVDLSPAAAEGRSVSRSNGCAACHGSDGAGGVGPPYVGLFGSQVALDDGTTVVADRDYLVESIVDPSAKIVEGYRLKMPANDLSAAEVDAIVTYIEELAPSGGEVAAVDRDGAAG